ncbi:MAG: acetyl-CoA carboxylase biotin carboxylase subunit [Candidatus Methanomethylicota archaeon]|uniref:Pyruvate carboxylase subunit A n=1 Tax=Thermoproteota archaeon TaxID=2056631 RepID=A0A497ERL5_9CREN|nr:MAG: acetyl-CoA carboxylase biotin carboxylase subunit [Candidatus Verstraetearchaeota archaeon]RLE49993.1 MAG: acetyl-CoA carboxylase biotin carboxylase subunit [Candidatus Verstraetearchaeota archaeon]
MGLINKVLIANRGEIAVRIIRACKELGIKTVAVYSEADKNAKFVYYADEAYYLGPGPAKESYLNMEKIIEIAKQSGAEAIHPGYGFLAQNAKFVKLCDENDIIFIGPPAKAQELLGDKIGARKTMSQAGIPIVPGSLNVVQDEREATRVAEDIGYPVMVKPAGGGGGIGMQICWNPQELAEAIKKAQALAASAFARPEVYIEKYLVKPRHIEIQILADTKGNVIHLGERECSIQRRHQKLIEEAPSPVVDEELRKKMGETAVKVAKIAGYVSAGTVEFLFSEKDRAFYFLEVNSRIQVEHPVTELITGIDIVKEQLYIASGEPLRYKQEDITWSGHAIECRINAEDPTNDFLPSSGLITNYIEPGGPGIRVDSGVYAGYTVPVFYDPLIAKLLAWGRDRNESIARMRRALDEFVIEGIRTNIPFHKVVLNDEEFIRGNISTEFIADRDIINRVVDFVKKEEVRQREKLAVLTPAKPQPVEAKATVDKKTIAIAAAIAAYMSSKSSKPNRGQNSNSLNPWVMSGRVRPSG